MKFKVKFKCDQCGEVYYNCIVAKSRKDATRYKRMFKDNNSFIHYLEGGNRNNDKDGFTSEHIIPSKFKLIDGKYVNDECHECCSDCSGYCGADCPLDIEGSCVRCEFRGGAKKDDGCIYY